MEEFKIKFHVISYPDSYWLIPTYIHQFNKYVPNAECVIMCYEHPELDIPLPENIKIVSITDGKPQGGCKNWASTIRKYFETLDDKYVIFSLDDFLITEPMNIEQFQLDMKKVKEYDIKRYALGDATCPYYSLSKWDTFLKFDQNSEYRLSCQVSVWDREFLIRYLKDNWNPWDFEIIGARESKKEDCILVYNPSPILTYMENGALSRRYGGKINIKGMNAEDISYHQSNGNFKGRQTFIFKG